MAVPVPAPEAIQRLPVDDVDALLDRLEREVPTHPPFVTVGPATADEAIVFGDSHGDWPSVREVVGRFEAAGPRALLLGLGDYVDRTPGTVPHGSAVNALYLLAVAARYPDRAILLQGNHETDRRIPVAPRSLPDDLAGLWGESPRRLARVTALLERGPIAAATASGAYCAHAGFPRGPLPTPWAAAVDPDDRGRLGEIVWAECGASVIRRGVVPAFSHAELDRFLGSTGLSVFLRGHDPDLAGRPVFGNRCLTLHTTVVYERYGGILVARLPLGGHLADLSGVRVEHLATERGAAAGPAR